MRPSDSKAKVWVREHFDVKVPPSWVAQTTRMHGEKMVMARFDTPKGCVEYTLEDYFTY